MAVEKETENTKKTKRKVGVLSQLIRSDFFVAFSILVAGGSSSFLSYHLFDRAEINLKKRQPGVYSHVRQKGFSNFNCSKPENSHSDYCLKIEQRNETNWNHIVKHYSGDTFSFNITDSRRSNESAH